MKEDRLESTPAIQNTKPQPAGKAKDVEGNDAVCFTAGLSGAAFGAGVVHAYLAADREPPKVAAGISMGALNAAAMQRVYQELEKVQPKDPNGPSAEEQQKREAGRWRWFREYVNALSSEPLNVFWDAIPDQSDFFADMVPIQDTSTPDALQGEEREARRRRYLLVRLGQWLAKLPVRVGLAGSMIVNYVRFKEKYPFAQKLQSLGGLLRAAIISITELIMFVGREPQLFPEYKFASRDVSPKRESWAIGLPPRWGRGFLSWLNLFNVTVALLFGLTMFALVLRFSLPVKKEEQLATLGEVVGAFLALTLLMRLTKRLRVWLMNLWPVRNWLLPGFAWVLYLLAWFNILPLMGLGWFGFRWVLEFLQQKTYQTNEPLLLGFFALLLLPNLLLLPFVSMPETRTWLVDRGFLQQWKRPLFGWPVYLFVCVHLAGLASYLLLGGAVLYTAERQVDWDSGLRLIARGSIRLLLLPLLAVAVIAVLWWIRGRLVRRGILRQFPQPRVAWTAFGVFLLAALGGTSWWFYMLLMKFKMYFPDPNAAPPELAHFHVWESFCVAAWLLYVTWNVIFAGLMIPEFAKPLFSHMLDKLGLRRGLIHDYHLRRKLLQLFDPEWKVNARNSKFDPATVVLKDPTDAPDTKVRALIVAALLPTLHEKTADGRYVPFMAVKNQLWARPGTPLIHALRTALAVPPLFEPTRLETKEQLHWWIKSDLLDAWMKTEQYRKGRGLDLVDGSVVRQNPLPALFSYLRNTPLMQEMSDNNDKDHPAIHVVYRVPLEGKPEPDLLLPPAKADDKSKEKPQESKNTIVDVARLSLRLSARRDTQLEVVQTNAISRMETAILAAGGASGQAKQATSVVFADEIAPQEELEFKNVLEPSHDELLTAVASGCRRTLETLYKDELAAWGQPAAPCHELLASLGKTAHARFLTPLPGLPEVCQHCVRTLARPPAKKDKPPSTVELGEHIGDPVKLARDMDWLTAERPRLVFVASGGVFRGAFHIGMLAALAECKIQPDLIVGASVGTLMGGALAAMFRDQHDNRNGDILSRLLETFLKVDDKVALTKTLKGAARELGLRGRLIHLSPGNVRSMVQKGSRSDAGFAVAGAPAALIDALSDLFMIPHRETSNIAAEFIAGHVTEATNLFLQQLKKETLKRLAIESAVIGTPLLEAEARALLGASGTVLTERQPFKKARIAFFGTTTNLITQSPLLLGGNGLLPHAPYDYVEAALASSAFPAVFAPRPQSQVFPGIGREDILFSDGGMFDNLPFLPAIEILAHAQRGYRSPGGRGSGRTALEYLQARHAKPDLMIAGALNALPEEEPDAGGPFETLAAIHKRARSLQNNDKIRSFEFAAMRIHNQIERYLNMPKNPKWTNGKHPADTTTLHPADGMVDSGVLPVFPASPDHLNGTFAFCASTGLEEERVKKSVADGCYQTLLAFAGQQSAKSGDLTARSVRGLMGDDVRKIPVIERQGRGGKVGHGICHFFRWNDAQQGGAATPQRCPFAKNGEGAQGWGVYKTCEKDEAHAKA